MIVFRVRRFLAHGLGRISSSFGDHGCVFAGCNGFDRGQKSITTPWKSLHKSRVVGRVIESPAESLDGGVEAVFKINVSVSRPESPVKLFARHQLTGILEKADKNL